MKQSALEAASRGLRRGFRSLAKREAVLLFQRGDYLRSQVGYQMQQLGYDVYSTTACDEAVAVCKAVMPAVMLIEAQVCPADIMERVKQIREFSPETRFVVVEDAAQQTAQAAIDAAHRLKRDHSSDELREAVAAEEVF